ncbi:MAG: hypothetical protein JO171_07800 [Paludibacterium sp.]|uniref:hypothetical protein n=1 Tax=Paludibacterium sp. TaxID=1917523 RepID=UPI0025E14329|nr:hypothetical protein [Paludibacterium sp.]MBV8047038.1 hypothetical protein [Paludibacterium sp.]MBV8646396.1 hypothetical protein [Paludibacterium sp.]
MKQERITVLGPPEFKAFLLQESRKEGISLSELVQRRCRQATEHDEAMLTEMTDELAVAVDEAKRVLAEGLVALRQALGEHAAASAESTP